MADPLSVAAGVAGLATLAAASSKILYETVDGIKNSTKTIQEVKEEAESLSSVLESLQDTLAVSDVDFSSLKSPLSSCTRICGEFTALIRSCSTRSGERTFSLRDFFRFSYKGKTISEFRSLVSAYKSTISIALADANLRQVVITTKLLEEYRYRIDDTASELDELLQRCTESSYDSSSDQSVTTATFSVDITDTLEERESLQICIDICSKISKHIDEVEVALAHRGQTSTLDSNGLYVSNARKVEQITSERLTDCKTGLGQTTDRFRLRLREVESETGRLLREASTSMASTSSAEGASRHDQDLASIQECLSICRSAEEEASSKHVNIFEDVSAGDDCEQAIVSTFGDLISAKRVRIGARSSQILGQMSDESFQSMSSRKILGRSTREQHRHDSLENGYDVGNSKESQGTGRYGPGYTLG